MKYKISIFDKFLTINIFIFFFCNRENKQIVDSILGNIITRRKLYIDHWHKSKYMRFNASLFRSLSLFHGIYYSVTRVAPRSFVRRPNDLIREQWVSINSPPPSSLPHFPFCIASHSCPMVKHIYSVPARQLTVCICLQAYTVLRRR